MLRQIPGRTRAGASSTITLLTMPIVLAVVGLVSYVGLLRSARSESQTGADAAALAAGFELASDDLLTTDIVRARQRLQRARNAAIAVGSANSAAGERLTLDANLDGDPDGDIAFGRIDYAGTGEFVVAAADPKSWIGDRIDAVQISTGRDPILAPFGGPSPNRDVRARSLAILDWQVVGFRPLNERPIPLMPIGLFADSLSPARSRTNPSLPNVEHDDWHYDSLSRRFEPGADGIAEVSVVVARSEEKTGSIPGMFIRIGVENFEELISQISVGAIRSQLERKSSSGFTLGLDNILRVPGAMGCPGEGEARRLLNAALANVVLSGEPRIWPLLSGFDEEDGSALIAGFAAARAVSFEASLDGGIRLLLQPAVIHHPSVVVERRQTPPGFWATNKTVCRVRLAQ